MNCTALSIIIKNQKVGLPLLFVILMLFPLQLQGSVKFKVIDNRQGLPDNSIHAIQQDARGFIWMATFNGLCRYDGTSFTAFRHDNRDVSSLRDNNTSAILPETGGVWVGTSHGLDYFSFKSGTFLHGNYRLETRSTSAGNQQKASFAASHSRLKDFSSGVCCLLRHQGRVFATDVEGRIYSTSSVNVPFTQLSVRHRIISLRPYLHGQLLGVGPDGIYLLTSDARRVVSHYAYQMKVRFNVNLYYSSVNRTVYVGYGIGHKGYAFRVENGRLRPSSIFVPSNLMKTIDYKGKVLFALDGKGLLVSGRYSFQVYTPRNSNICGDALYTMFVDRDSNLWIGTYRAGLSVYSYKRKTFSSLNMVNQALPYNIVTAVCPKADNLYVGFDGGGFGVYNRTAQRLTAYFTTANSQIPGDNVLSIVQEGDNLWMGIYSQGLVQYNFRNRTFTAFTMPVVNGADDNNVWTLYNDHDKIWVGGPNLCVFNKRTHRIFTIPRLNGATVSSIVAKGNTLWAATRYDGIYAIDRSTYRIIHHYTSFDTSSQSHVSPAFGTSADSVYSCKFVRYLFIDSQGTLWFNVEFSGFFSYSPHTKRLASYGLKDGLSDTNVTAMQEDAFGNLWMATYNGLFRYDPRQRTFVRYDEDEDIASVFTYNSSAQWGGKLFFGTTHGLVCFIPQRMASQQRYQDVSLMSLRLINDETKTFHLYGSHPHCIQLNHDQNFFTIAYAVPEYDSPKRIHFSCYLKGLEKGWREMGGVREVQYTNVPPGEYQFYVRCTDSTGRWSRASVLCITVSPPWYLTWWARILWLVSSLLILYGLLRIYLHEIDVKHRMQIVEVQQNTMKKLNEAKMNFYTNVTHELRTPIFLISAQIEELLSQQRQTIQIPASYLDTLRRSSDKLNKLVSRIIDFRKMDINTMRLNLQRRNVVDFCENLSADYIDLCAQKNISYGFHCSKTEIMLDFDLDKLETIITNLVSNAFKYTKQGGHVLLNIKDAPDVVELSVSDDGIGIVEKMREVIFENFSRTERGRKQSEGDGIGLASVRQLVGLHGGVIYVESEVNHGSSFIFTLPKRNHGTHEEIEVPKDVNVPEGTSMPKDASVPKDASMPKEAGVPISSSAPACPTDNPTAVHSILIIDDERDTVDLLMRNLSEDFKIYKAYNGEEGMALTLQVLPDLIICDWMMPGMDGLQFLTTLKNDKKLASIKIIIFTAKSSEEDKIQAFDHGTDAYITKPISLKYLRKRIDKLLEQSDNATLMADMTKNKKTYTKEEQLFLLRCREIIDDNLQNEEFDIEVMADQLSMSHSSLYKKIKAMTGMSLIEFINDYKLYKAVRLFQEGVTNVERVCEQCGFKDVKNFRSLFKRRMNTTPKQYIQSL